MTAYQTLVKTITAKPTAPACTCNATAHANMHRSDCEKAIWFRTRP